MYYKFIFSIAFIALVIVESKTNAATPEIAYELPKLVAVEPKAFNPHYDVTANFGILPIDAFYKGIAAGVSYTHSYNSAWQWEILNANINFKSDTNLKTDLIDVFQVRPAGILDYISWYTTSNAIYTPIYSKNLLFNRELLYGSFSFVMGGGTVGFNSGDIAPMLGGGLILRAFHSATKSSKLDLRIYQHFASSKSSDQVLILSYGLSFELGDNKPWQ